MRLEHLRSLVFFFETGNTNNMEFFGSLTDDELALLGCAVAIAGSATIMWLSYFIGRSSRREQAVERALLLGKAAPIRVRSTAVDKEAA